MIKLHLILIYDTDFMTSRLFGKSFTYCMYNPRMDYAFCLLALKGSKKWRPPLFCAICNFNLQITIFINTNVFYLLPFRFSRLLVKIMTFSFKKSLKIPKGKSESVVRRRTDNTIAKRKSTKGQTTIYKTYT